MRKIIHEQSFVAGKRRVVFAFVLGLFSSPVLSAAAAQTPKDLLISCEAVD